VDVVNVQEQTGQYIKAFDSLMKVDKVDFVKVQD
jgi:hypothetical protein